MKNQYGWVVVGAGALMGCVAMGTTFSLAVFLQPMSEATGWSRTGVSMAMTLVFLTMGVGGFGWGALTDRFGPRIVVLSGALLLGAGLALASRATSLLEFQLVYGIVVGASAGIDLRAHDGHRHRLVRQAPQSRRLAGFGRHGRGADDHLAVRAAGCCRTMTGAPPSSRSPSSPGHCWCRRHCWSAERRRQAPALREPPWPAPAAT